MCLGQDPNQVLERTRARVVQATRNLPRFTCLETVDREYFEDLPVHQNMLTAPPAEACPALFIEPVGRMSQWTDRLRLEVTIADGREIHAWPTASEFDTRPIDEIVSGPINTGGFGGFLSDVFDNPGTHFTFMEEQPANGKKLFKYAYRTPLDSSHYSVGKAQRLTAHGGWFLIDAKTLEVVHLVIHTDPLPTGASSCRDHNAIDYHQVPVGDGQLILPIQSVLQVLELGGSVSKATATFSSCHEYRSESTIRFGEEVDSQQRARQTEERRVPAEVHFTLRTTDTIDFRNAAAGDRIVARVVQSSDRSAVPQGATVSGRISLLRHYMLLNRYQFAFTPEILTVKGVTTRLGAVPERPRTEAKSPSGFRSRGVELAVTPPGSSSQEASFVFPGSISVVKPGFESLWVTISH
jgi:hypothetical protein